MTYARAFEGGIGGFRKPQRGASFWSLLFLLFTLGFYALLVAKCFPIYMNQFKVSKNIATVAKELRADGGGQIDMTSLQKTLEKHWDIEDIEYLNYRDVRIVRKSGQRFLSYDYEARENLFYNIFIVLHFNDDIQIPNGE